MKLPPINIENMDIKLSLGGLVLNVLYVKFGYFYRNMPEHSHSHGSYELHYIPSGRGLLVAEGERYPITSGTLFMTGPGVSHEQITDPEDPMAEYCIFFEILPGDSILLSERRFSADESFLAEMLTTTPFWIGQDRENMMGMFEILACENSRQHSGFHHNVTNILEMIVIRLLRQYTGIGSSLHPIPLKTLDDNRLLTIENSFL
jgi:hypothetical protein